jgi:hypothetical protein
MRDREDPGEVEEQHRDPELLEAAEVLHVMGLMVVEELRLTWLRFEGALGCGGACLATPDDGGCD